MTTVNDMIARMKSLKIKDVGYQAVTETKEKITDIQREQMFKGLDADGNKIRRYRNNKYAIAKNAMNPLPGLGVPDLKLTGAFYRGFITDVTPEIFSTRSTDIKNDELTAKYNPFGLNVESKTDYSDKLRPVFVKNVKEKLQI